VDSALGTFHSALGTFHSDKQPETSVVNLVDCMHNGFSDKFYCMCACNSKQWCESYYLPLDLELSCTHNYNNLLKALHPQGFVKLLENFLKHVILVHVNYNILLLVRFGGHLLNRCKFHRPLPKSIVGLLGQLPNYILATCPIIGKLLEATSPISKLLETNSLIRGHVNTPFEIL